jgi:hypothetical protein
MLHRFFDQLARRLSYANVVATVALFAALGGGAYAALSGVPDKAGVFHGCADRKSGALRVVQKAKDCKKARTVVRKGKKVRLPGELAIAWNQQGPQGQPGSDATVNGMPAGGDLTGTFPNPSIAAGAVGPSRFGTLPMVRAPGSPGFSVPDSAATDLQFTGTPGTADFDTNGMHSPTTNPERLTAKTAGTYLVYAFVSWPSTNTAGTTRQLGMAQHFASGGFQSTVMNRGSPSSAGLVQNAIRMVHMQPGDYVTVAAFQNSGSTLMVFPLDFGAAWLGP